MRDVLISPDQIWGCFRLMDNDVIRFRGWKVGLDKFRLAVTPHALAVLTGAHSSLSDPISNTF